jgi:hypothetical protein
MAAGMSFAFGYYVMNLPSDPYLPMIFEDEEILMGLRAFSYGYNYGKLERPVVFHVNAVKAHQNQHTKFSENDDLYHSIQALPLKRISYFCELLHNSYNNPNTSSLSLSETIMTDATKYGLGQIQSIDQFFRKFGQYLHNRTLEVHALSICGCGIMTKLFPPLNNITKAAAIETAKSTE